jgi:hypothetical protein
LRKFRVKSATAVVSDALGRYSKGKVIWVYGCRTEKNPNTEVVIIRNGFGCKFEKAISLILGKTY